MYRARTGRTLRGAAGLAVVGLLVGATTALAAAHFVPHGLYTGTSTICTKSSKVPGTTCTFKFRASASGHALRFVGKTVISIWACNGGGGEAFLGGRMKYHTAIPVITLGPHRALRGATGKGSGRVTVTGHLSLSGKTLVLTFHSQTCVSPKFTLHFT